jgi:hypothetical protein
MFGMFGAKKNDKGGAEGECIHIPVAIPVDDKNSSLPPSYEESSMHATVVSSAPAPTSASGESGMAEVAAAGMSLFGSAMAAAGALAKENEETIAAMSAGASSLAAAAAAMMPTELKDFIKKPSMDGLQKNPLILMMMYTFLSATRNPASKMVYGLMTSTAAGMMAMGGPAATADSRPSHTSSSSSDGGGGGGGGMTGFLSRMAGASISQSTHGLISRETAARGCQSAVDNMSPEDMTMLMGLAMQMSSAVPL